MKKRISVILGLALVLSGVLLAGCSSDKRKSTDVVGEYELASVQLKVTAGAEEIVYKVSEIQAIENEKHREAAAKVAEYFSKYKLEISGQENDLLVTGKELNDSGEWVTKLNQRASVTLKEASPDYPVDVADKEQLSGFMGGEFGSRSVIVHHRDGKFGFNVFVNKTMALMDVLQECGISHAGVEFIKK